MLLLLFNQNLNNPPPGFIPETIILIPPDEDRIGTASSNRILIPPMEE